MSDEEVKCPRCKGLGDIPAPGGAGMTHCHVCKGRGVINQRDYAWKSKWATTDEPESKPAARTTKAKAVTAPREPKAPKAPKAPRTPVVKPAPVSARSDEGRSPLHAEASDGFVRGVRELLESGADVNARDANERTPLHWPAYRGFLEVVQLLVDAGAEVNARDSGGRTPLRMAIIGNRADVQEYLREHGGEV